jgi:hypothetical protein
MFSSKQCTKFVLVQVRIFNVDVVNSSKNSTIDDALRSKEWRCWPSNAPVLSKDLTPVIKTLTRDHQSKTNDFNLPAMILEMKSTEFPV